MQRPRHWKSILQLKLWQLFLVTAVLAVISYFVAMRYKEAALRERLKATFFVVEHEGKIRIASKDPSVPLSEQDIEILNHFSSQLSEIGCTGCDLSTTDFGFLANAKSLEMLRINGSKINSSQLACLNQLPKLEFLEIAGTPVTDDFLLNTIGEVSALKRLCITIDSASFDGLADCFSKLPNLERVWISGGDLTDQQLEVLAASHLPKGCTLRRYDNLFNNKKLTH